MKRPYLRAAERRRQLLDAAARLFDRHGFGGITMVALAAEAGVSRQLVYDHFSDLSGLYSAFVQDRLARYDEESPRVVSADPDDLAVRVRGLFRHLVGIPAADRRIIRLVVADTGAADLDDARRLLRDRELARWGAVSDRQEGLATALIWTTMSAFLALADAVESADVTAGEAEEMAIDIVQAAWFGRIGDFSTRSTRVHPGAVP